MIVYDLFEGDDIKLAWQQHDVYPQALQIISDNIVTAHRNACHIAGMKIPETGWPNELGFDHRTVQDVHDRLAAVWRYYFKPPQAQLPLIDQSEEATMENWLSWLMMEMQKWKSEEPDFVRNMVIILQNQNEEVGYDAEDYLNYYLYERFSDIPWTHELIYPADR